MSSQNGSDMTIEELVRFAELHALSAAVIERACVKGKLSIHEVYTAFAKDVHEKYIQGIYTWRFCDAAMNSLYSYAYVFSDTCLPDYAWHVFIAFDEGEYIHPGDPIDFDCETRTKALLGEIVLDPLPRP
jgi:hypothetical protein